jgi:succinate dehydrogenase/fumarate reductase flavoprotein subunit
MAEQSRYETQQPRFTEEEAANYKRPSPHVLIVGAGLAGLYLAILLEEANISYQVFERAAKVKPLGKSGFSEGSLTMLNGLKR